MSSLSDARVQQKHIAQLVGVDPAQLSRWLAGTERIGEPDIYRVCWILAGLQDGSIELDCQLVKGRVKSGTNFGWKLNPGERKSREGRSSLGGLLKRLQQAAGYLPYDTDANSPVQDLLFDQLTNVDDDTPGDPSEDRRSQPSQLQRRIILGYFGDDPILGISSQHPNCRGIAQQIVQRISLYLGVNIEWKRIDAWASFGSLQSLEHRVHFFAPRMAIPRRSFSLRFTRPIPLLSCGINAIGRTDLLDEILGPLQHAPDAPFPALTSQQLDRLLFAFVPGNIGEFAGTLFYPSDPSRAKFWELASVDDISIEGLSKQMGEPIKTVSNIALDEAAEKLFSLGTVKSADEHRVPVLVTGQLLCHQVIERFPQGSIRPLFPLANSLAPVPYSFGVAHTEPRLFQAIDYALKLVYSDVDFMTELYLSHLVPTDLNSQLLIGQFGSAILDPMIERDAGLGNTNDRRQLSSNIRTALRTQSILGENA